MGISSSIIILCAIFISLVSSSSLREPGTSRDDSPSVVDLGYATYRGSTDPSTNITSFLSIRYAAPPIGTLRFQAPQAPGHMTGIQNATSLPPQCFQAQSGTSPTNPFVHNPLSRKRQSTSETSEDCLFLDVSVPDIGRAKNLPVVVWIHGGGYDLGGAAMYPQASLVADSQNRAIAVTIQYRLGAFGFLAGPSVKKRGALNAGLLDQHFALKWVQQYVSAKLLLLFGGDPTKVTIWGQSDDWIGAGSVLQHVVAHAGRTDPPLFRAAITTSAFLPPQYAADDPIPTLLYDAVVASTNCTNAVDPFACLVTVDSDILSQANNAITSSAFYGTNVFVPVVDGTFITERPTVTLDRQVVNGVSLSDVLLSVTNAGEGIGFVRPNQTNTTDFVRQMFPYFSAKQTDQAASYYTALNATLPQASDQAIAIMGESIFICPTHYLLKAFNGKSWKGEFAIPPAYHGDDLKYYFPSFKSYGPLFNNTDFIKSFSQSFLDVVLSLNPNTKFDPTNLTPAWNHWSSNNTEMLFNKTSTNEPDIRAVSTDAGLLERCA
ncbi:hypothetical protein PILCRDRAFT_57666 [Piloderma croceum F 1598]|uniref:Carboxylesterase type B domain-containing protein n=1 Tax=Piloderma croceum (strain F 1598) TaxID=765440 RepID=A0A0C3GLK6_PILCF|nr:hypothetical protein PILCRDRAFT_57666 [Piloderma croceum F 1598]